ncbi:FAD-dependent oxidoreductase [Rheinheimera sp.]|jgi:glycine oxidase|uniref:FAD-dependent oxidoreductase n=1 Tax=Rheinheimera sp. TaxID=1869214 RepID=UPI0040473F8E
MSAQISSVVLGAGLMGRLLAHTLAQLGHLVTVHEAQGPDAQGAAARVAAAMLAPLAESAITELPVVRMGQYALTRWPELIAPLPEPVFFQQNGTLVLWHRQDAAEAKRFALILERTQQQLPNLPAVQTLDAGSLLQHEPALETRFNQALYLPGEGQLDNRQLLVALLKSLEKQNVQLHWHSPRAPEDFQAGQPGQPDWVFDCRGLGARNDWPQLRGVRGEVIRLYAPQVTLQRPTRLIHPRYPIYIAPKPDHVFVIGATEIETEDVSPASVRSTLELLSAAYTVHSGFAEARILEVSTQARPTLSDNLPALRCLGGRTMQINGLYRHGFLISPAMLDVVVEWVQNHTTHLATQFNLKFDHVS